MTLPVPADVVEQAKLVLLDFWYAGCVHCRTAIPHLKQLQAQYGPYGLEVVGIACEKAGTAQEQALRVARLCQIQQTNYRLLLAGGLTPENVAQAIRAADPYAVDVASGVETGGEKDPQKIRAFVARVAAWNSAEVRR